VTVYLVTGRNRYREHAPGERFEAYLEPAVEKRALRVGAIQIIERSTPGLQPGSFTLPRDWQSQSQAQEE
jgi:hypothetical protein